MIPDRVCSLSNACCHFSILFGITQHTAETIVVDIERQLLQVCRVELETFRILLNNLINAVNKLQEYWRYLSFIWGRNMCSNLVSSTFAMGTACVKWMAKAHEVFFHKD